MRRCPQLLALEVSTATRQAQGASRSSTADPRDLPGKSPLGRPIIIHITNDPIGRYDTRNGEGNVVDYARAPDLPKPRVSAFFESVFDPITALFGTRGGHAVRSILLAKEQMDYVRFQVFDQRPVDDSQPCDLCNGRKSNPGTKIDSASMSWWLSGAVQEYLDRQLCQSDNANEYTRLQSLLYNQTEGNRR